MNCNAAILEMADDGRIEHHAKAVERRRWASPTAIFAVLNPMPDVLIQVIDGVAQIRDQNGSVRAANFRIDILLRLGQQ